MTDKKKTIKIMDTTLRDGSHSVRHQFTLEDITAISSALDESGVYAIEISHGDGLAGSSIQYGWSLFSEEERLSAANQVIKKSKLAVLLLPGIGTREDLQKAIACGTKMARIATHVTEADISEQHIKMCKDMGLEVVTFLMLAHMEPPSKVLEQAKLMESYGADVVYVVDSAGAMLPDDVRAKVGLLREHLKVEVGFHAHNNLGLGSGTHWQQSRKGQRLLMGVFAVWGVSPGMPRRKF